MPVLPGVPPVEITLRRSARTRRFSLRVSRLDGRVTLSLPAWARETEALAFARDKEGWIRTVLAGMPEPSGIAPGSTVPVEGRMLALVPGSGRLVRVDGESLVVPGDAAQMGVRVAAYLRTRARDRLQAACDLYAGRLGRPYSRLSLRDTRSRWGSCSPDGALMFSWRLIMAPPQVLDYVAAHEVAHLEQMNHSPAFWEVVSGLMPHYAHPRRWLKAEGQALHAYRFRD